MIHIDNLHFIVYSENITNDCFDISDMLQNVTYYKILSLDTAKAMELSLTLQDKAEKVKYCGTYLSFNNKKIVGANFCRERFCPMCQRRKALRTYSRLREVEQFLSSEYQFLHLVLTINNCPADELTAQIDTLYRGSRKMFNNRRFKQGIKGVLRCLEVSYNAKYDTFHPHLHCLCAVRKSYFTSRYYLKQDDLRMLWSDCIGTDYLPQVNVKKCDENALAEVAKYCVKPLELDIGLKQRAVVLDALNLALKSRRNIQTYGVFREAFKQLKIDLDSEDNDKIADNENIISFSFDLVKKKYVPTKLI